ncbi:MAG: hypothetical protein J5676_02795 [Bacteroidaceae bacterium]|nr:hypothetical protein [Bacteroidaceae bacterium]
MTIVGMMASVGAKAQLNGEVVDMRRGCIHHSSHTRANDSYTLLPSPYKFDPDKIYRVPVVLISFNDLDFSMDAPADYYNRIFNEYGYNEGVGPGCVAELFPRPVER